MIVGQVKSGVLAEKLQLVVTSTGMYKYELQEKKIPAFAHYNFRSFKDEILTTQHNPSQHLPRK